MKRRSHTRLDTIACVSSLRAAAVPHYYGVTKLVKKFRPRPYLAQIQRQGKKTYLGSFATAEEAALRVAQIPESLISDNTSGYFGVVYRTDSQRRNKPYQAQVRRDRQMHYLGSFATAEEAALCVASSPEGRSRSGREPLDPPPPPLFKKRTKKTLDPVMAVAAVPMTVPALEDGAIFGADDVRVDDVPSFSVPGFTLKPTQDEIYEHYGLLAIETYDEGSDFVCAEKSALCFAMGSCFGPAFEFSQPPPPIRGGNRVLRREAAIREHQAAVTDYMLKVY